jgi:hypothetical protein
VDTFARTRLRLLAALIPPLLLLGWRLFASPPGLLWRDGATILSLYALFVVACAPESRFREPVTIAVMLLLMGIYGSVQLPLALAFLREAW